jgi:hypothetical protein
MLITVEILDLSIQSQVLADVIGIFNHPLLNITGSRPEVIHAMCKKIAKIKLNSVV